MVTHTHTQTGKKGGKRRILYDILYIKCLMTAEKNKKEIGVDEKVKEMEG